MRLWACDRFGENTGLKWDDGIFCALNPKEAVAKGAVIHEADYQSQKKRVIPLLDNRIWLCFDPESYFSKKISAADLMRNADKSEILGKENDPLPQPQDGFYRRKVFEPTEVTSRIDLLFFQGEQVIEAGQRTYNFKKAGRPLIELNYRVDWYGLLEFNVEIPDENIKEQINFLGCGDIKSTRQDYNLI